MKARISRMALYFHKLLHYNNVKCLKHILSCEYLYDTENMRPAKRSDGNADNKTGVGHEKFIDTMREIKSSSVFLCGFNTGSPVCRAKRFSA
jgi:hypothetical protein